MDYSRGSEWHRWDLHLHTQSSYDYQYSGDDADELLCNTLKENDIVAVAITDHFTICKDRIEHLRSLAPEITFFPGVELRTDKGANNLHLIIIFPETCDLGNLADDFQAIMVRQKAKSKDSPETIHWDFQDIVDFAKSHKGLISVHAGRKTNGLEKEIPNTLPVKEAVKKEIATSIDFFEVGQSRDIKEYQDIVFQQISKRPIVMCSDNHDPRDYKPKECLWIKANPNFEGLLQCVYQPEERVFVGDIPPNLDRAQKNKRVTIEKIGVHQIESPKNTGTKWFDFEIPLNSGLVAIIGNKGSGKSALADIIGHLSQCSTMGNASFLNDHRFRKGPKNYAADYDGEIIWADGTPERRNLGEESLPTTIQNAQYLPQQYIEEVCNDIDRSFQDEIDKVIFSYVDSTEKGDAKTLADLVALKSSSLQLLIGKIKTDISNINIEIANLEKKLTTDYRKRIDEGFGKMEDTLSRHMKSKPAEVSKPINSEKNTEYQTKLADFDKRIAALKRDIATNRTELTKVNGSIDGGQQLLKKISLLQESANELNGEIERYVSLYNLKDISLIKLSLPDKKLRESITEMNQRKLDLITQFEGNQNVQGLSDKLSLVEEARATLIDTADSAEKKYQKYRRDLENWETEKQRIIGSCTVDETLEYYKFEREYLDNSIYAEYENLKERRAEKARELYKVKKNFIEIYESIYSPIRQEISNLLGNIHDDISFATSIELSSPALSEELLKFVDHRYGSKFRGKAEATNAIDKCIRETDYNDLDSVIHFADSVLAIAGENADISEKRITDKITLYNKIFSFDYFEARYKLQMGNRNLEELSPGERGIVLLIFYLALSKNNIPIIIDQPEDNLDNQSVFGKLVPCICEAKKKRQVIIVTHNPNIAVACDAEQIIYSEMDKTSLNISYSSGAIEDNGTKLHVIDVLEGTMPAFNLRQKKYS